MDFKKGCVYIIPQNTITRKELEKIYKKYNFQNSLFDINDNIILHFEEIKYVPTPRAFYFSDDNINVKTYLSYKKESEYYNINNVFMYDALKMEIE